MQEYRFIHLHVHSHYSLLDSTCRINDLVNKAVENQMSHLALTDHGNLFGAIEFFLACKKAGIQPIIGMEAYITPGSRHDRKKIGKSGSWPHLVLLATNETGYRNLVRLSSSAYVEGFYYKPRIDKEILSQYHEGLIGTSACISGEINRAALEGRYEEAKRLVFQYQDILGKDNFFLEIMDHGMAEQKALLKIIPELSKETGAPLVATSDVHYISHEDARAHEIHMCIKTGKTIHDTNRMKMSTDKLYFRSTREMIQLFKDYPEAIKNTVRIAERINFDFNFDQDCLPEFHHEGVTDNKAFFQKLCDEGFQRFYPNPTDFVRERFKHELTIIERMGYVDYFLIVWDFIRFARENEIPVGPGRGSAAGSVVAYCLEITQLNPLKYDLLFERFLNEERISMPDIDIDFCMDKRGLVIDYVKNKYGSDRVCQIITFGRMAARAVIRDVGRVLEIPLKEVDAICKKIPSGPGVTLKKAFEKEPELRKLSVNDSKYKELFEVAEKLEGLNRNAGTHAAGVVIGDRPLMDIVPLYKAKDTISTQYSMENLEKLGLLKMDFLGLRTLTVIDIAVRMIKRNHNVDILFDNNKLDDKKTYEILCRGEGIGVFQLESSGMRELLKRMKPDKFEDLIALLALYRPGPLGSDMDKIYVRRKHGEEEVSFLHEKLRDILMETNGVILYQEQVMRIANVLGGFSMNEADNLRKAMGKKKLKIMARFRQQFIEGAVQRDVPKDDATYIFDLMEKFAKYGFNKSHSAAYALISYQTAFLKANWPAEFMAAVLSCEMHNTDKIAFYIEECKRIKIPIKTPDINVSVDKFTVVDGSIIYALSAIKNIGEKAVKEMVARRNQLKDKRFSSIYNFCEELGPQIANKTFLESLTKAGAFDSTFPHRSKVYGAIEKAIARGNSKSKDRASGQMTFEDLLADQGKQTVKEETYPDIPPWTDTQQLTFEKEVLGLYLTGHPLNKCKSFVKAFTTCKIVDVNNIPPGRVIIIAGQISALRTINTRRGDKMAFLTIEDLSGTIEAVLFPDAYKQFKDILEDDSPVFLKIKIEMRDEKKSFIINAIIPLEKASKELSKSVTIAMDTVTTTEQGLFSLKRILGDYPGACPVEILFKRNGDERGVHVPKQLFVNPDRDFFNEVKELPGLKNILVNTNTS